jgi:HK97 family phage prohead protease
MNLIHQHCFCIKATDDAPEFSGHFSGYASTFEQDRDRDRILPGSFQETLTKWQSEGRFPHVYSEHDPYEFIGICTLLKEDEKGLYIEGKLLIDHIQKAAEVYQALKKGINGLSIGFYVKKSYRRGNIRFISQVDLKEISIVQEPCNQEARIGEYKASFQEVFRSLQRLKNVLKTH